MIVHEVRTYRSTEALPRSAQLAWAIAEVAADPVELEHDVIDMAINRVIDNAAVAAAALGCHPVVSARVQARAHPYTPGATVFGLPSAQRVSPEWAA